MRILFLNYEYPPLGGGAANATKYLLREIAKREDIEVDLITSSVAGFSIENISKNVRIHFLDIGKDNNLHYQSNADLLRYSWKSYRYAKRLMKKNEYDICHAFFGIPCGYVAMKLGLPYIVSLRGSDVPFYNERFKLLDSLFFKRLSGKIWRNATAVVANSSGLKDLALSSHSDIDIEVIPNGVDVDHFARSERMTFMPKGVLRVVSVGRLIERKGFDVVISAMEGFKNISLTIIGEGPEKQSLIELARKKGVDVDFVGAVSHDDMVHYYHQSDVFVLASKNEGMSNAMLEAMASGLPVLTTRTGGVEEMCRISADGFVFFSSSLELKNLIKDIVHVNILLGMSLSNLNASRKFSWSSVLEKYYQLY